MEVHRQIASGLDVDQLYDARTAMFEVSRTPCGIAGQRGAATHQCTRRCTMTASAALKQEVGGGCRCGLRPGERRKSLGARDFIVRNVTPFKRNEDFLAGASQPTNAVWAKFHAY